MTNTRAKNQEVGIFVSFAIIAVMLAVIYRLTGR